MYMNQNLENNNPGKTISLAQFSIRTFSENAFGFLALNRYYMEKF